MLTTYHHPVPSLRNLGTLTSWNPLGLSRPVTGLLYLLLTQKVSTYTDMEYFKQAYQSPGESGAAEQKIWAHQKPTGGFNQAAAPAENNKNSR